MQKPGGFRDTAGMKRAFASYARRLYRPLSGARAQRRQERSWRRDPLSHPDIQRMSERERADLQFMPCCIDPD